MVMVLGVLGLLCPASTPLQAEEKPGAKLKRFDVWLGEWAVEQQGKDIQSGEELRIEGKAEISRLGDHYYVRTFTSDDLSLVVVIGYDTVKDAYCSEAFSSDGTRSSSIITFGDKKFTDNWTHTAVTGETIQERCEVDLVATQITFECRVLHDGEWTLSAEGTGTRVK
jgi:hypothetical protein